MEIHIPQDQYEKLTACALAAGYADVAALIAALALEPSEEQVRTSAVECERGIAEIKAGRAHDFRAAMLEIGRERGFSLPE